MEQIICTNLEVGYDKKAVAGPFDITIKKGDYWCITGANGAGKSTFIKTILSLTPVINGDILYNIQKDDIGYLPQQKPHQKNFPASVKEIVMSGFANKTKLYYNMTQKEEAKKNINLLDISHLQNKPYASLSGGQQQRVLLARALCATSKIIILDEPVSGLDPSATTKMYKIIKKINKSYGITIVMISHDVKQAAKDATKSLHLNDRGVIC
ncbi:MAG: hypothetical protein ATN35_12970 [Epulopiscium sp. Nele67-Bin004]|nr:MAG: hypothetical protein ATN35_12970 [Epulopiscium sp. Nele67-Bin004]